MTLLKNGPSNLVQSVTQKLNLILFLGFFLQNLSTFWIWLIATWPVQSVMHFVQNLTATVMGIIHKWRHAQIKHFKSFCSVLKDVSTRNVIYGRALSCYLLSRLDIAWKTIKVHKTNKNGVRNGRIFADLRVFPFYWFLVLHMPSFVNDAQAQTEKKATQRKSFKCHILSEFYEWTFSMAFTIFAFFVIYYDQKKSLFSYSC